MQTGMTKRTGSAGAWSTLPIGGVDGGTVQATAVLLGAKILFGNLRVNPGVRRGPAEQSAEQNHSGRCNQNQNQPVHRGDPRTGHAAGPAP